MVAHLPDDQPIPWPRRLQFLSAWSDRVLGPQRQAALKVGLLGAYIGRGLMLVLAIGGELVLEDLFGLHMAEHMQFLSISAVLFTIA